MIFRRLRAIDLDSPRATSIARLWVPLLLGAWSMLLGVDANYDLFNYHLYNPFALLNGKLAIDFAGAGMHGYFNPLIDLPYYAAISVLPAPGVAFAWGALHRLNRLLVLRIAREALSGMPEPGRRRIPLLLALAAMTTAQFFTGLGNTMGDNVGALFSLGGVALLLAKRARVIEGGFAWALAAGVVTGLGVGLKLTNAPAAVALVAAALALGGSWRARLQAAALLAAGVALGMLVTGGWWHYTLWATFGNPMFPMFGGVFPNDVARSMITDTRWHPRSMAEALAWPFLFSRDSTRIQEFPIRQVIWGIAYGIFGVWAAVQLARRARKATAAAPLPDAARFVIVFVVVGYLAWLEVFSYGRYSVAFELLLPLLVFLLLQSMLPQKAARWTAAAVLAVAVLVVSDGGYRAWTHAGWSWKAYDARIPALEAPERTGVLTVINDRSPTWLATFFPPDVAFVTLGNRGFPEGPGFATRVERHLRPRTDLYVLFPAAHDTRVDTVRVANEVVRAVGLGQSARGCWLMESAQDFGIPAVVAPSPTARCELKGDPAIEASYDDGARLKDAREVLAPFGLSIDEASCTRLQAYAGWTRPTYHWCRVTRPLS